MSQTNTDVDASTAFRSRKRTRNPSKHEAAIKKRKVQEGDQHVTLSGQTIGEKTFCVQNSCQCNGNCPQRINVTRQKEIFSCFYKLMNWSQKTLFLRTLVKKLSVKDNMNPIINLKARKFSNQYYLIDESGNHQQVCLNFLLKCIQISRNKMFNATTTVTSNEPAIDKRGNFPTRKTSDSDILFVKKFIDSLPRYESHYKLSHTDVKYLGFYWNIKRLYREYCIKFNFKYGKKRPKMNPISEWKFRNIFNTQFNLRFSRPKADTCGTCDKIDAEIKSHGKSFEQIQKSESEKQNHLQLVESLLQERKDDLKMACDPTNKTEIFVFDLQRALEMPILKTGEAFYKRQLWFYNLCVYDKVKGIGYMYVWNESVASRGSQEIASCLYKHLFKYVPKDTRKIILLSDSCGGQNRNIKMSMMLKNFLSIWQHPELKSIQQHFYVSGHSYNSCDSSFSTIEKQKRSTQDIFSVEHWINVIRQAKKKEPKFVVTQMTKTDFFSSESLEKLIVNRKKTISGEKINWFRFQKIIYERENQFLLKSVDYGNGDAVQTISLAKRGSNNVLRKKLNYLYPDGRPISKKKYDDLQQLSKNIPEQYRSFYRLLRYVDNSSIKDHGLAPFHSSDEEDN